jgi:hypothetical protein
VKGLLGRRRRKQEDDITNKFKGRVQDITVSDNFLRGCASEGGLFSRKLINKRRLI